MSEITMIKHDTILDASDINRILSRITHNILEVHKGTEGFRRVLGYFIFKCFHGCLVCYSYPACCPARPVQVFFANRGLTFRTSFFLFFSKL